MTYQNPPNPLNRRAALAAGGAASALIVTGCSTYSASGGGGSASSAPAANDAPAPDNAAAQGGATLGPASSVPVGGGKVFADQKVVVTQPAAGQFKAFSAVCTHQGCTVNAVAGGTINCPCHGSKYKIADGSVANGPAKRPLDAKKVSADGGTLRLT
ncbi:Rieske (2Fe-2S) protein [Pseudonocardia acaciae]|uniref:Rieske (2Fe-2S) protein n=1 Tax=Pseudonocardia acaciae TaxID=551276 RepID=UPI00055AFB78|nr:Rieske (2Fe-2S) protein [Pseudonocardia acaciae]